MENASKALIMAGAILISILLISLGIKVFNSTSGIADEVGNSSEIMSVSVFNSRFTKYFGSSVSATQVQAFIRTVIANNSIYENRKLQINIYNKSGAFIASTPEKAGGHKTEVADLQDLLTIISPTTTYQIRTTTGCGTYSGGYDNAGYIRCITVQEN